MASTSALALLLFVAVVMGVVEGVVYKVGDSEGWTTKSSPNYTAWASSKSFHVGDTILFEYDKNKHNVLEVSEADYATCKTDSPIATYTTGKDSITITTAGAKFYICGVPGHCQDGQKVEIHAGDPRSAPLASPAPSPHRRSPSSPPPSISPTPSVESPSGGSAIAHSATATASVGFWWALASTIAAAAGVPF